MSIRRIIIAALVLGPLAAFAGSGAHAAVVEPFTIGYQQALYGDFVTIGDGVMGCAPADAACESSQNGGPGNDNQHVPVAAVPPLANTGRDLWPPALILLGLGLVMRVAGGRR